MKHDTNNNLEKVISIQSKEIKQHLQSIFDLNIALDQAADLLSNILELRDPYTKGHCERVAEITVNIAHQMFPKQLIDIKNVKTCALLHDIGKLAINENILNKSTKLTEAEYIMIQSHTTLGEKLIRSISPNKLLTEAILFHHEDYDGGGYPKGLHGEDIPLIARIIRVADYFDALTTNRSYRASISDTEAVKIMKNNKRCFDPNIFKYFSDNIIPKKISVN
ncbi:HD-GYP domain-containing protein [Ghiorsea bivora]|uniref:HD-GYP domain-containing protein n=1 Tax=Ghiorsea bivora TaxID=1485545 RepID=UPI00068F1177|nr:HD domain-containing phosphohydrolase [Ghiorsea bivora]